jgi:hypothetical protein
LTCGGCGNIDDLALVLGSSAGLTGLLALGQHTIDLVGALDPVALAAQGGQPLKRGLRRCVAQRVAALALRGPADEQPLLGHGLVADRPDRPGGELVGPVTAFDRSHPDPLPGSVGLCRQGARLDRWSVRLDARSLEARADVPGRGRGHRQAGRLRVDPYVGGHVCEIHDPRRVQPCPQPPIPPVQLVAPHLTLLNPGQTGP